MKLILTHQKISNYDNLWNTSRAYDYRLIVCPRKVVSIEEEMFVSYFYSLVPHFATKMYPVFVFFGVLAISHGYGEQNH